jgi:hypothetical protein
MGDSLYLAKCTAFQLHLFGQCQFAGWHVGVYTGLPPNRLTHGVRACRPIGAKLAMFPNLLHTEIIAAGTALAFQQEASQCAITCRAGKPKAANCRTADHFSRCSSC